MANYLLRPIEHEDLDLIELREADLNHHPSRSAWKRWMMEAISEADYDGYTVWIEGRPAMIALAVWDPKVYLRGWACFSGSPTFTRHPVECTRAVQRMLSDIGVLRPGCTLLSTVDRHWPEARSWIELLGFHETDYKIPGFERFIIYERVF